MELNVLCIFGRGHYEEHFCEIILNLGKRLKRRCWLKVFLSGGHVCLMKQNCLSNFGREHYGEHSCEIILNLDQWFRKCC